MRFEEADEIANEIAEITDKIRRIKSIPCKFRTQHEQAKLDVLQMELTHLRRLRG